MTNDTIDNLLKTLTKSFLNVEETQVLCYRLAGIYKHGIKTGVIPPESHVIGEFFESIAVALIPAIAAMQNVPTLSPTPEVNAPVAKSDAN